MKRVKVNSTMPPADRHSVFTTERLYTVALGNHVVVRFSSERDALAFQATTSRWLSDVMMELNILLADAYSAYRLAWPLLPAKEEYSKLFRDAEESLDRATMDKMGPNAVFLHWKALQRCVGDLRQLAIGLEKLYVQKTYAVPRAQMNVLIKRCNALAEALRQHGTDEVEMAKGYRPSPYDR